MSKSMWSGPVEPSPGDCGRGWIHIITKSRDGAGTGEGARGVGMEGKEPGEEGGKEGGGRVGENHWEVQVL